MKTQLRNTFSALILSLLTVISPASANPSNALKHLHELQTLTYTILTDYYMFSGLEGDSRYSRDIDVSINQFEATLTTLTQDGNRTIKIALLGNITSNWQSYKQLINVNRSDISTQGYGNSHLVSKLEMKAIELNANLAQGYQDLFISNPRAVNKWAQYSREMTLIIQKISAEYIARSANSSGQVVASKVNNINEGGIDKQAREFSKRLNKLKGAPKASKFINKNINQMTSKWTFIEKSVTNYNENTVPFIVNSYSDRITKSLTAIGEHYQELVQAKK